MVPSITREGRIRLLGRRRKQNPISPFARLPCGADFARTPFDENDSFPRKPGQGRPLRVNARHASGIHRAAIIGR
jgi:hypothetical protein